MHYSIRFSVEFDSIIIIKICFFDITIWTITILLTGEIQHRVPFTNVNSVGATRCSQLTLNMNFQGYSELK